MTTRCQLFALTFASALSGDLELDALGSGVGLHRTIGRPMQSSGFSAMILVARVELLLGGNSVLPRTLINPSIVVRSQHPFPRGKRKTEVFEVFRYLFMRVFSFSWEVTI